MQLQVVVVVVVFFYLSAQLLHRGDVRSCAEFRSEAARKRFHRKTPEDREKSLHHSLRGKHR